MVRSGYIAPAVSGSVVVHVGNDPAGAGGIASVIRAHLARDSADLGFRKAYIVSHRQGVSGLRRLRTFGAAVRSIAALPRRNVVVHVHMSRGGSLLREGALGLVARIAARAPVVVTVHGSGSSEASALSRVMYRLALVGASRVHLLVRAQRRLLSYRDQRTFVLPNDVPRPASVAPILERDRIAVFLGDISYRKGVDVLIPAWRAAAPPQWDLHLYGPADEAGRSLLRACDGEKYYRGQLDSQSVLQALLEARLMILPSRAEAMPMAILEAMAAGCAVVATPVGAVPELLGGSDAAHLAAPGSPEDLARRLRVMLGSDKVQEAAASRNRAFSENYSADRLTREWRTVYEKLLVNASRK